MAVWIDPAIEFIVREAHQDMGSSYEDMEVVPLITEDTKLMLLVWNEGEIKTLYTMEQQGVYVSVMFEPQILGYNKRQVGRALYDFENALIGSTPDYQPLNDEGMVLPNHPAHHNVGGHPIRQEHMKELGLESIYKPLTGRLTGSPPDNWWPTHIVQKVTVEGSSIKYDPIEKFWRGRLFIHAHIANAGFGGLD